MVKTAEIVSLSSGVIGESFVAHEVELGVRRLAKRTVPRDRPFFQQLPVYTCSSVSRATSARRQAVSTSVGGRPVMR